MTDSGQPSAEVLNSVSKHIYAQASTKERPDKEAERLKGEIGKRLGITQRTLYYKLTNRRQFKILELWQCAEVLNVAWHKLVDIKVNAQNVPL